MNTTTEENKDTEQILKQFTAYLTEREASRSTKENYVRYVRQFLMFADGRELSKNLMLEYRDKLLKSSLAHTTINLKLVSVNRYLESIGREECRIKLLKIQRKHYVADRITEEEYGMLLACACENNDEKYYYIMRVLGATGIRIQELSYFTVQNLQRKKSGIEIWNKNKCRTIVIPEGLRSELLQYAEKYQIKKGPVFLGNRGKAISRGAVWKKLKDIAKLAGVESDKIYPHAFRHFFAFSYIQKYGNVSTLADILGHASVEVTRIYIQQTMEDTRIQLEALDIWKRAASLVNNLRQTG